MIVLKLKEVYRHLIQVEYNDGIEDITKAYEYFSTKFMDNDECNEELKEIQKDIDCLDFRVVRYLAEREVL